MEDSVPTVKLENDTDEKIKIDANQNLDDTNVNKNTKLHVSSAAGNLDEVKHDLEILKLKVDSENFLGWTPLMMAVKNGHIEVVRYLLEKSADVTKKNKFGINIFMMSVTTGNLELMKLILQHLLQGGISRNRVQENLSPLSFAILFKSKLNILEWIVEKGFDMNAPTVKTYLTPFMFASASRNTEAMKFLMKKRADENCENYMGLHYRDMAIWRKRGLKVVLENIRVRAESELERKSKLEKKQLKVPKNTPRESHAGHSKAIDPEKLKHLLQQSENSDNTSSEQASHNNSSNNKRLKKPNTSNSEQFSCDPTFYTQQNAFPFVPYVTFVPSPHDGQNIGPLTPVMVQAPMVHGAYDIIDPIHFMSPYQQIPMSPQVFFSPNMPSPMGFATYPSPVYVDQPIDD